MSSDTSTSGIKAKVNQIAIGRCCDIYLGYPFRGKINASVTGGVCVIQPRNVSEASFLLSEQNLRDGLASRALIKTELEGKKKPDYLQKGDILFLAKGARNFAVCLNAISDPSVCSPSFFYLRLHTEMSNKIMPEFLAWQLNFTEAQSYFARSSQGSIIPNITRQQLHETPIYLPNIEQQQSLVKLALAAQQEKNIYQQLQQNRQQQIQAVAQKLFHV